MARKKKATRKAAPKKKTATKSRRTPRKKADSSRKKQIYAVASPRSVGGVSMFDAQNQIDAETVGNFYSDDDLIRRSVSRLQEAGFDVLQVTHTQINFRGTKEQFSDAFATDLYSEERAVIKEFGVEDTAEFFDSPDTDLPGLVSTAGTSFDDVLEGVAIEEPRYYMAASMFPPLKKYWHLDVPAGVSLGCNADKAHRAGYTGRNVKVAMCDSGWFKHPFFVARGYRAAPVTLGPGASNPLKDESGHGTGESANIFAVAPDVELMPVKMNFFNTIGAFNAAVALNPDIITNSWGSHKPFGPLSAADQAMAAAIAAAVASGIIVIFSAGNGHGGFPGQHPDVISAGGVFMDQDESLQASNYSSGFMSTIYPNRRVPDVCGLVGMRPKAIYIMLPLEPGDNIDVGNSGGTHPNGDETAKDDGWAAFSGTSAAAPQLAGAAALVKQACPALKPAQVRDILRKTARDVTKGKCSSVSPIHTGLSATVGPDVATGDGLVDAHKAALLAKIRCLGPIQPIQPVIPIQPVQPPVGPIRPIRPPIQPIQPIQPIRPPIQPIQPIRPPIQPPIRPIVPPIRPADTGGAMGAAAAGEGPQQARLSVDEVEALEEMILQDELDLES